MARKARNMVNETKNTGMPPIEKLIGLILIDDDCTIFFLPYNILTRSAVAVVSFFFSFLFSLTRI